VNTILIQSNLFFQKYHYHWPIVNQPYCSEKKPWEC